jgi:arginyl-tRNA--protein-N-Asp/Glu arginylyltransferase
MKNRLAVLKNRVLRRIFGSKRSEVTRKWRTLYKKELYSLYTSPNQKQHALWRGEMHTELWWENLKEGDHLEYFKRGHEGPEGE